MQSFAAILRFERLSISRSCFPSFPREDNEDREPGTPPLAKTPSSHRVITLLLTYQKPFLVTTKNKVTAQMCFQNNWPDLLKTVLLKPKEIQPPFGVVTQKNIFIR